MKYLITEGQEEFYKLIRRKSEINGILETTMGAYKACSFESVEKYVHTILRFVSAVVSADYDTEIHATYKVIKHFYNSYLIETYNKECGETN